MKTICSTVFLLVIHLAGNADIANIGFENNHWIMDKGVSVSGEELTIIGDATAYRAAQLSISVPSKTASLYFTVNMYAENITPGKNEWECPKLKIYNQDNSKLAVFNIQSTVEKKYFTNGIYVPQFDKMGTSVITLEISIQNATGTLKVKNPRLLNTLPKNTYQYPFEIPADPACTIDLNTDEKHQFENDLLSVNSQFVWSDYKWGTPEIDNVIRTHFPMSNLRFPGGTVGNYYNYETDTFYPDSFTFASPGRASAYSKGVTFGYNGYRNICRELKATSTLMFNVIRDDITKSTARLKSRLNDSLAVKWVEMGNENYFGEQRGGNIPNIKRYITHTKALAASLKAVDSTVRVAVNTNTDDWDAALAKERYYDAIVVHEYINAGSFLLNAHAAKQILSAYTLITRKIEKQEHRFPGIPQLLSEWNINLSDIPVTFLHTLGIADMFLGIENKNFDGPVKQAGIHILHNTNNYSWGNLTIHSGTSMSLTSQGVLYAKLFDIFKNNYVYNALSSSSILSEELQAVYARAVEDGDSIRVFVVNKLPVSSPLKLSINGTPFTGSHIVQSYHNEPDKELTVPVVDPSTSWNSRSDSGSITIPPYTIAVVNMHMPVAIAQKRDYSKVPLSTMHILYNQKKRTILIQSDFLVTWKMYTMQGTLFTYGNSKTIDMSTAQNGCYIIQTDRFHPKRVWIY